jgi:hypothetical protein
VRLVDPAPRRLYLYGEELKQVHSLPAPESDLELGPADNFG